jgi:hypothetical protein
MGLALRRRQPVARVLAIATGDAVDHQVRITVDQRHELPAPFGHAVLRAGCDCDGFWRPMLRRDKRAA